MAASKKPAAAKPAAKKAKPAAAKPGKATGKKPKKYSNPKPLANPNGHGGRRTGAGRPSRVDEAAVATFMDNHWPVEDRVKVVRSLHTQAVSGNYRAAQILLAYAYGTPRQVVEHAGGAEVVVVRVPDKISADEWLQLHKKE